MLLVIDATTGQNGLTQARIFAEVVDITGIVLTKLDGSAKGGIVDQVQRELGVPVKFIGLGEGADGLAPFDAENFVDACSATDCAAPDGCAGCNQVHLGVFTWPGGRPGHGHPGHLHPLPPSTPIGCWCTPPASHDARLPPEVDAQPRLEPAAVDEDASPLPAPPWPCWACWSSVGFEPTCVNAVDDGGATRRTVEPVEVLQQVEKPAGVPAVPDMVISMPMVDPVTHGWMDEVDVYAKSGPSAIVKTVSHGNVLAPWPDAPVAGQ